MDLGFEQRSSDCSILALKNHATSTAAALGDGGDDGGGGSYRVSVCVCVCVSNIYCIPFLFD